MLVKLEQATVRLGPLIDEAAAEPNWPTMRPFSRQHHEAFMPLLLRLRLHLRGLFLCLLWLGNSRPQDGKHLPRIIIPQVRKKKEKEKEEDNQES